MTEQNWYGHAQVDDKTGDLKLLDEEFDIVEDIPAELEDFVFMSRLGLYQEARNLYEQNLQSHLEFFPVLAEYADMLLEEGAYSELSERLNSSLTNAVISGEECQLLSLMEALSEAHKEQMPNPPSERLEDAKPKLEAALSLAQKWHNERQKSSNDFGEAEVGLVFILACSILYSHSLDPNT